MTTSLLTRGTIASVIRNDDHTYEGNLIHYFRAVFNHAQNLGNGYHNFRHLTHVMWLCHEACLYYATRLSPREMRNLLIAALFHDFDHTGISVPDVHNIMRAVRGLALHLAEEDMPYHVNIADLIEATEYPHVELSEALSLPARILRDADMGQSFSVAWIQQVVFGFSKEWGMPPLEVLKRQEHFHEGLVFETEWARQKFPRSAIEAKVAEAREMILLLADEPVSV
ncbi:MAG: hypothetical protein JWN50_676 [Parcubacteria group bacterium]|nr:hypothetical protein [Parcubacteria group bacterium]